MCKYEIDKTIRSRNVPEFEIEAVFEDKLLKLTDNERHIDCSACGYKTCRHMAEAIALGINHHDNCVYYVKNTITKSIKEKIDAETELRKFVDVVPLVTHIADKDFNIVECNQEALRLFNVTSLFEYRKNFRSFWPETQPDGRDSTEKAMRLHARALQAGHVRFDWMMQNLQGEPIPCEISLLRFIWNGEDHVLAFIKDLRELHKFREDAEVLEEKLKAMTKN
jgi:PAS domain-containing protein